MKAHIQLVTDIMGTKVKTPGGEEVGVVQNIMVDTQKGTIIYIILCYANFIGKINRHFAIPRTMLKLKQSNKAVFLEIDEKKLQNVPRFIFDGLPVNFFDEDPHRIYELLPEEGEFAPEFVN